MPTKSFIPSIPKSCLCSSQLAFLNEAEVRFGGVTDR
jgi:hypothetical protein